MTSAFAQFLKTKQRFGLAELASPRASKEIFANHESVFSRLNPIGQRKLSILARSLLEVCNRASLRPPGVEKEAEQYGSAFAPNHTIALNFRLIEEASLSALSHVGRHEIAHLVLDPFKKPLQKNRIGVDPYEFPVEWVKARDEIERRACHGERVHECLVDLQAILWASTPADGLKDLQAIADYHLAEGYSLSMPGAPKNDAPSIGARVRVARQVIRKWTAGAPALCS